MFLYNCAKLLLLLHKYLIAFCYHGDRSDFGLGVKTHRRLLVNDFLEARDEMSASRRNGAKKLPTRSTKKRFSEQ